MTGAGSPWASGRGAGVSDVSEKDGSGAGAASAGVEGTDLRISGAGVTAAVWVPTSTAGVRLKTSPVVQAEIAAGSDARFRLLFDGKPLADTEVTLFRAAGNYDGRKIAATVRSDARGGFTLRPGDAGLYLILVRHRTAAPAGSETPYRSYTYTLAFDAA